MKTRLICLSRRCRDFPRWAPKIPKTPRHAACRTAHRTRNRYASGGAGELAQRPDWLNGVFELHAGDDSIERSRAHLLPFILFFSTDETHSASQENCYRWPRSMRRAVNHVKLHMCVMFQNSGGSIYKTRTRMFVEGYWGFFFFFFAVLCHVVWNQWKVSKAWCYRIVCFNQKPKESYAATTAHKSPKVVFSHRPYMLRQSRKKNIRCARWGFIRWWKY